MNSFDKFLTKNNTNLYYCNYVFYYFMINIIILIYDIIFIEANNFLLEVVLTFVLFLIIKINNYFFLTL